MGKRSLMRLAAVAAGGTMALAMAAPAFADTGDVPLNDDHKDKTAADAQQDCTGPLADLPEGKDGWHFVLPATSGDDFVALHLVYTKPDTDTVNVDITSTDEESPSTGAGWEGFIDNAGEAEKHAYVITDAGWTLTDGTAEVTDPPLEFGHFNLSHACAGVPGKTPTPTPSASTPPATTPPATTPPGEEESPPPGEEEEKPGLPVTGPGLGGLLVLSGGLLAAGVAMVAVRRRRNLSDLLEG